MNAYLININFFSSITHFFEILNSITTYEGSPFVAKFKENITVGVDNRLEIHCKVSGKDPKIRWKIGMLLRYLAIIFPFFLKFCNIYFLNQTQVARNTLIEHMSY